MEWGAVRVSDIPAELMTWDATSQRIEWLESRLEEWMGDDQREAFERLTELQDAFDAMEADQYEREEQATMAVIQSYETESDQP